jgi:D-methionine transport system permease protein
MWIETSKALLETIEMVTLASLFATLIGLPLGILLNMTRKGKLLANQPLYYLLSIVINATRSIPFIILMLAMIPLTRLIVGTSIGLYAAVVPLTFAAIPFFARVVETALNEVPAGLIEAAQAMGASPRQIIQKVLVPEAWPGIISGLTLTVVNLVGYSAMAGAIGGGGLGSLAYHYGYQRFDSVVMFSTVIILIILVQIIQSVGDYVVHKMLSR